MNAATFLAKQAMHSPDHIALAHGERALSYSELARRSLALSSGLLDMGLTKGDRVALMLPNGTEVVESIYSCLAAGLVVVPINYRLHPLEVAYIVENSGARALITDDEFLSRVPQEMSAIDAVERVCVGDTSGGISYERLVRRVSRLDRPVDIPSTDPAWLFYTSGTTGRPKGAIWTHRMIRILVMNYLADLYNIDERDVVLHAAPLTHGSGIVGLPAIARGATNLILDTKSFEPDAVFSLIQQRAVTHIAFLAPTQIVRLLEEFRPGAFDLASLRAITYGGAPIYVEHLGAAIDAFGPVFVQLYGQGEAPITVTGLSRREHAEFHQTGDPRLGSAGRCRTDVELRIVDSDDREVPIGEPGEIVVRGDVVMPGYWDDERATAETLRNGWLHTGDIGSLDERGYLFLLDRAKDVIITGGNNVYPREVEEVLVTHPDVANVVVVGVPDAYWGEAVHAVIQLEPGREVTRDELLALCGARLAGYKKPKTIDFVEAFPQNAYGKILRREIRERYWQGQERRVGGGATTAGARS
jgi:acyl-CoA synthetase (AMP-forming)/AMP-acid ligase II